MSTPLLGVVGMVGVVAFRCCCLWLSRADAAAAAGPAAAVLCSSLVWDWWCCALLRWPWAAAAGRGREGFAVFRRGLCWPAVSAR